MRVPANAVIAEAKLRGYLLTRREADDKSLFLEKAGFTSTNWRLLEAAIRTLASKVPPSEDGSNVYGTFWRVEGLLQGPMRPVAVVMIWMQWSSDGSFHFVTLKPLRSSKS
jgi:hypothetical protein